MLTRTRNDDITWKRREQMAFGITEQSDDPEQLLIAVFGKEFGGIDTGPRKSKQIISLTESESRRRGAIRLW